MRTLVAATCNLNQWALDFEGNLKRIIESIEEVRAPIQPLPPFRSHRITEEGKALAIGVGLVVNERVYFVPWREPNAYMLKPRSGFALGERALGTRKEQGRESVELQGSSPAASAQ
jgi:hypothetical protein